MGISRDQKDIYIQSFHAYINNLIHIQLLVLQPSI